MGENRLKVGLGLLTVLATPIAVNSLAGSEAYAAEEKQVVIEKQVTEEIIMRLLLKNKKLLKN